MKSSLMKRLALFLAVGSVLVLGGCDLFNDDGGGGSDGPDDGDQAALVWTPSTPAA
jgi:hypothetical protein